jgi:hypothetical protein
LPPAPSRGEVVQAPPAPTDPVAPAADTTSTVPGPASAAEGAPLPPPRTARHPREQLNTKIRVDLRQRVNQFVERHDSTLQGVLEAALDEYMARRGWSWDDYHRAARRR